MGSPSILTQQRSMIQFLQASAVLHPGDRVRLINSFQRDRKQNP